MHVHRSRSSLATLALLGVTLALGARPAVAQLLQRTTTTGYTVGCAGATVSLDLNGDGYLDLLSVSSSATLGPIQICTQINPGSPGLAWLTTTPPTTVTIPGIPLPAGASNSNVPVPNALAARVDSDAADDLIVWYTHDDWIYVLVNNGVGGFNPLPNNALAIPFIESVQPFDANNDGQTDLIVLQNIQFSGTYVINVVLNQWPTGQITWSHVAGIAPTNIRTGDVNGDGLTDLIFGNASAGLYVATGNGNGTFNAPIQVGTTFGLADLVADLDGDGRLDVIAGAIGPNNGLTFSVAVRYGDAQMLLGPPVPLLTSTVYPTPGYNGGNTGVLAIADFDGDGIPDLLIGSVGHAYVGQVYANYYSFATMRGLGSRMFGTALNVSAVATTYTETSIIVRDLDGDGDPDLAVLAPPYASIYYPGVITTFDNRSLFGSGGCPGTGAQIPSLVVGSPVLGNAAFGIGLSGAVPNAPALLAVSLAATPATSCGVDVSLAPSDLLLPTGPLGYVTTDAFGAAFVPIPLPANPALHGLTVFAQWGVADPAGSLATPGGAFALSGARTIVLD